MGKLFYKDIKAFFERKDCILLEPESERRNWNDYKLKYICSCGNETSTSWNNFRISGRCQECGKKASKFSQEYVEQYFIDRNCKLLDKYQNANTLMRYICECGNEAKIRFFSFKLGRRCQKCQRRKISEKFKLKIGDKNNNWNPDREQIKFNKLIQDKSHDMVKNVLQYTGKHKTSKSVELLGYSRLDLKNHLTAHPNWEKVKDGEWSIDHIFPIKAFLYHGIDNLKLINCLDNLQPMLLSENKAKSAKYSKSDFFAWLATKGIVLS